MIGAGEGNRTLVISLEGCFLPNDFKANSDKPTLFWPFERKRIFPFVRMAALVKRHLKNPAALQICRRTIAIEVKIILDISPATRPMRSSKMCKRPIWNDFDRLSANRSKCDAMDGATIKLRPALAEARFDPDYTGSRQCFAAYSPRMFDIGARKVSQETLAVTLVSEAAEDNVTPATRSRSLATKIVWPGICKFRGPAKIRSPLSRFRLP
jgi:hypothetical protein